MHLVFNLFDDCNLQCKYCYKNAIPGFSKIYLEPMEFDVVKRIIIKAVSIWEKFTVNITGGEPLLNKALIYKIVSFMAEYKTNIVRLTITTNGTLISDKFAYTIKKMYPEIEIDVTIDGPANIHNKQRPSKKGENSHVLAIEGISNAINNNLKVTINSVITRNQLLLGADKYYNYMNSIGVPWILGRAITDKRYLKISEAEFNNFALQILDLWCTDDNYSTDQSNTFIDSLILRALEKIPFSKSERCANSLLSFGGNRGLVWPCTKLIPYKEFCLGSFLEEDIKSILNNSLRTKIYNLFQYHNTCAHEALIERGSLVPLPSIAKEREKLMQFLKESLNS